MAFVSQNKQIVNRRGLCRRQPFCYKGSMRSSVVGGTFSYLNFINFSSNLFNFVTMVLGQICTDSTLPCTEPKFSEKRDEVTTENPQVSQENQPLTTNQSSPPKPLSRSKMIKSYLAAIKVVLVKIDPNFDWNGSKRSSSQQRKIEGPKEDRIERDNDPRLSLIEAIFKAVFDFGTDLLIGVLLTMKQILEEVDEEMQRKSQEKEEKQKITPVPSHEILLPPQQPNHSWISTEVPTQRLHLVPKEQLAVGERVFYHRDHNLTNGVGGWYHGIWDGDAVIHVKMPRCNCADCAAAAKFNKEYALMFKKGDHLFSQCENNALGKPM